MEGNKVRIPPLHLDFCGFTQTFFEFDHQIFIPRLELPVCTLQSMERRYLATTTSVHAGMCKTAAFPPTISYVHKQGL
jgi:hypothetical protein